MAWRIALAALIIVALLLIDSVPASAERLGGAYRGPYSENAQPVEGDDPEVQDVDSNPDARPADQGDQGDTGDDATTTPPSDQGDQGDNGDGGPSGSPPPSSDDPPSSAPEEDPGRSSAPGTTAPDAAPKTGLGTGNKPGTGPGSGNKAVEDVQAYWPFWFEHNKEWIFSELLSERRRVSPVARNASSRWFTLSASRAAGEPVTVADVDEAIFPVLVDALNHRSSWVRDAAVLALGKLGGARVVPEIAGRLKDPQPDLREDALLALGLTGEKDALPLLLENLKKSDTRKPFAAIGLGLLGLTEAVSPLFTEYDTAVKARDDETAACIAIAIGMLGEEDHADHLAAPLRNTKGRNVLRVHVCQALGRLGGEKSKKWLLRALADRDNAVQSAAALALSNFPERDVVRHLVGSDGLKAGNRMTKLFAIVALGRIGRGLPESEPLRKVIRQELEEFAESAVRDHYSAAYASLSLAVMGDEAAGKLFLRSLAPESRTKGSKETRAAFALAAGLLEEKSAAAPLREIVTRGNLEDTYRGYSAMALGVLGDTDAKERIKSSFRNDRRRELLRSGCWAVGFLGDRSDLPWLIDCLTLTGSDKHFVRGAAALSIGLIGDRAAVAPLVEMAKSDPDTSNQAFAIAALGCLVDRSPVPRLAQAFKDLHYRCEISLVREALSNL